MHDKHSIRLRVSSDFSSFNNEIDLNWSQYLDWNETENSQHNHIYSEQTTSSSRRRKRRRTDKKKQVSQLFKITASIADLLSSLKTEIISHKENTSWKESLDSLININISELSKEEEAIQHKNLIQKLIKYQNINNVIIYSDDSKNENTDNLGAGIFYTKNFVIENSRSLSWNLNSHMKVFDAELFAIEKAFKLALDQISCYTKDIWVFSDSQAAIQRIQKSGVNADQNHVLAIEKYTAKIKVKYQVNIYLNWVPGHMNIKSNELADQAAKKETELQKVNTEKYVFFSFIKRKIKESALIKWQEKYAKTNKNKFYSQFQYFPRWNAYKKTVKKKTWSAFIQLKLDHEYFKSYLVRLSEYTTNRCLICDTKKNSEHLILHCKATQSVREELKQEFDIKEFSLKNLFNTKHEQEFLYKFLEKTQISTRNWLLQQADLEAENEE